MTSLDRLRVAVQDQQQADAIVLGLVIQARGEGFSWAKIADCIGVTRWATRQRYHKYMS